MNAFSKKIDVSYALLALPLSLLGIPLYIYLPLYFYENWQISLSLVGIVLLLTRLTDVLTDPLIGYLSDRWIVKISRWQQMAWGSLLLLFGTYFLFIPQIDFLTTYPLSYLLFFTFISFLGWTIIVVPYQALVAEITEQSHLKTRLTSFREGFVVLGVLIALSLPLMAGLAPTAPTLFALLWMILVVFVILGLAFMKKVVEPNLIKFDSHQQSALSMLSTVWKQHRWSLKLMPAYFLNNLANAFPATLFLMFVGYGLGLEAQAGIFLMVYFLSGVLALPVWFHLSTKIGKERSWLASMIFASVCFSGVLLLEPGDFSGYLIICMLTGLSLGADIALPASLQADIAQRLSKQLENVNGVLFGLWGLLTKLALAVAVGIALPLLDVLGIAQSNDAAVTTLWWLYAGLPILLKLMAVYFLRRFSSADSMVG